MRSVLSFFIFIVLSNAVSAQFKTPVLDGVIFPGEYGDHSQGQNRMGNWYCTWDDNKIYFAVEGANVNEGVIVYIDVNPKKPVSSPSGLDGMLVGLNYDNAQISRLPFAADFFTYVKLGYNDYQQSLGAGGWTGSGSFQNKITLATNNYDVREFAIPWSFLETPWTGVTGRPSSFNFIAYAVSSGGYVYNQVPAANGSGIIGTSASVQQYFTVANTANTSSTPPFANLSYSDYSTSGATMPGGTFYDVTLRAASTTTTNVRINNSLNLHSSSSITAANITLSSTNSRTAYVAPVSGTITGPVTVERFIPAASKRAWQLLAAPFVAANAPTILNAWQEAGSNPPGYGTHITQTGGAATNGFDASTTAYSTSVLAYNGTALQPLSNTNNTKVTDDGGAHFLFVRGDRTIDINSAASSSNTTLRATGAINIGNVTAGIPGSSFSLIPNPYPSAIDFEKVRSGNGNTLNTFYKYDASLKNYRVVERINATTYQQTPTQSGDNLGRFIESGAAFFIAANTQLNFTESMKTDSLPSSSAFKNASSGAELSIHLHKQQNNAYNVVDGIRVKFDNSFDTSVNGDDIIKLPGFYENIAVQKAGSLIAVEKTKMPLGTDSIQLNLWNLQTANYRLELNAADIANDANVFVRDAYLNTLTPVNVTGTTLIDFAVDKNLPSSFAANRFTVVFNNTTVLSCDFAALNATTANGKNNVSWLMCSEENIVLYELQSSSDGKKFASVASVEKNEAMKGNYTLSDELNSSADAYYRVKAIRKDGSYKYSVVVKVGGVITHEIAKLIANPVKNSSLQLMVTKSGSEKIHASIYNANGQEVYRNTFSSSTSYINVDVSTLSPGVYFLNLSVNDGFGQQLKFIKE